MVMGSVANYRTDDEFHTLLVCKKCTLHSKHLYNSSDHTNYLAVDIILETTLLVDLLT